MNITQINHVSELLKSAQWNDVAMQRADIAPTGDDYNTLFALVAEMARAVLPLETATVQGERASREVAWELVAASVSFTVEPQDNDAWAFAVKREHVAALRAAVNMAVEP